MGPEVRLEAPGGPALPADFDAAARLRVLDTRPDTEEAARAALELGFHRLFARRDPDGAAEMLRRAARSDRAPYARTARGALGRILLASGRPQQAAFELRKVVTAVRPADLQSVQARSVLIEALHALGKGKEAEGLRSESVRDLERISGGEGVEAAMAAAWLGFERKHDGDRRGAKSALEAALAHPDLPDTERAAVRSALAQL